MGGGWLSQTIINMVLKDEVINPIMIQLRRRNYLFQNAMEEVTLCGQNIHIFSELHYRIGFDLDELGVSYK